jgi:hypothetical protein
MLKPFRELLIVRTPFNSSVDVAYIILQTEVTGSPCLKASKAWHKG